MTGLICSPLVFGWAWWMQHFLLGGRIGWRPLLGGAVSLTIALFGLSVFLAIFLSGSITGRSHQYGPIGVVFALLSSPSPCSAVRSPAPPSTSAARPIIRSTPGPPRPPDRPGPRWDEQ